MKYDAEIYEFPEMYPLDPVKEPEQGVIFSQANRLMLATPDEIRVLKNFKQSFRYSLAEGGVEIFFDDDYKYYDLKTSVVTDADQRALEMESQKVNDSIITGYWWPNGDRLFFCKHLDTGEIYTSDNEEVSEIKTDGIHLFVLHGQRNEYIACFDLYLNKKWEHKEVKDLATGMSGYPGYYLFDDSVIINGATEDVKKGEWFERINFELKALYKDTGKLKWSTIFEKSPSFSALIEDKFYLYRDDHVICVDAHNGNVLFERPIGFDPLAPVRETEKVCIYAHNGQIFVFSLWNHAICIFGQEMDLIQEIVLPEAKSDHSWGRFVPTILAYSTLGIEDCIYSSLKYYTKLDALLILKPAQDDNPHVSIKKRPDFILEKIKQQQGHAYKLSIDSNNLDEVVSSGEYELMEIAQYCGVDRSEHDHSDPELNDHLIYSVNKSILPEGAEEDLKLMVSRVNEFFKTFLVESAKTGKTFKVELELR